MDTIRDLLARSPIFTGLPEATLDHIAGCSQLDHFDTGAAIVRSGEPAVRLYIIRRGRVSIQLPTPTHEPLAIATRRDGDAVGWSWLFKPYRWHFDAIAAEPTRVISVDGECLRGKCTADHDLGYLVMSRFADLAIRDLELTQLQLVDVYGHGAGR